MKDRFSGHARQYAAFRPTYPGELYDFIFGNTTQFDCAWDAGTGNGQVATDLAKKFRKVLATDISANQLEHAHRAENIFYAQAAEATTFQGRSIDLITVAQAIHWFDREKFYREVKRVARTGASLAVWGYGLLSVGPEIDPQLIHFYAKIVGKYWDAERKLIDDHYRTISFPFEEIRCPDFYISFDWTLDELRGYLCTWSSVQKYIQANGADPVDTFIESLQPGWPGRTQKVRFPLFLRLGKL